MPPKVESPEIVLSRARLKRDCALSSIERILVTALEAQSDSSKISSLEIHAEDLDNFVDQFQRQQDCIINALIDLDRVDEFDKIDRPTVSAMETIRLEIKTIVVRVSSGNKSSSSSSTATVAHQVVPLPKIQLPLFNGNLLEWRSFRDIYVSLIHDNTSIGDAERFHYLLSCLSGAALAVVKSIPLSANNYSFAWEALSDRFDNKRLLTAAHLDKLFAFKPIAQESLPALLAFVNVFKENVSIVKSLGGNDLSNLLLFHMGSRVLDPTTLHLFESGTSQSTIPNFDDLLHFVQHRCKILTNLQGSTRLSRNDSSRERANAHGKPLVPIKSVFTTTAKPKSKPCLFCDKYDHDLYRCPKFVGLTVEKRRETVASQKLCFACMSPTHMVNACSSKRGCRSCHSTRHHTLLHRDIDHTPVVGNSLQGAGSVSQPSSSTNDFPPFSGSARTNTTVVLGTAIVHIRDAWNKVHAVRVLLDSGSQISAMTSECSARLGLPKRHFGSDVVGLAQGPVPNVQGVTRCQFTSYFSNYLFPSVDLVILTQITTAMPAVRLPLAVRQRYQHLRLADKEFDVPSRIDALFGADVLPSLIRPRAGVEHHIDLPSALDTHLGWIIFGSFSTPSASPFVALTTSIDQPSIGDLLHRFWEIEEPAAPVSPTTEDQWCEDYFQRSTSRDASGRFCVALPFRDLFTAPGQPRSASCYGLGDSRSIALKRFFNLEKRLTKNAELRAAYQKFMSTYQALGHMVPAPEPGKYFIPHHSVLRADADMSKIRVVFDASSVSSTGRSLNDVLCTGPKLQTDLHDILLRGRVHKYMLTVDIVKMYRQILISPEDRPFQHIFWRHSPDDDLQEFQLCTITYGLNCAPYLAIRCLHELDLRDGHRFPLAKGVLTQAAYVDDIVIGADTEEQLLRQKEDIVGLLRSGACELSKWASNSTGVIASVQPEDRICSVSFDPRDDQSVKILGLHWDMNNDNFAYHANIQQISSTKRQVLSVIARLFDPIGALGPLLLWAKCFMQLLWRHNLGWDDPLPVDLLTTWQQFCLELPHVFTLNVPRYVKVIDHQEIQLLGFADASTKGYAATIYLRVVNASGGISVRFITCKTKIAPLKSLPVDELLSIPRLELCGALLLAQTLHHIHSVLSSEISIFRRKAWSDSSIVLSWLTSDQKHFKVFVTNRVAKIHHLLPDCEWNYIPTTNNPADPASRGLLPKAMLSSTIYWNGPEFLQSPEEQWPESRFMPLGLDKLPETKTYPATMLTVNLQSSLELFDRFSSLGQLQRVLAYVFRFLCRLRRQSVCVGPLRFAERETALLIAVRWTQQHHFSELIKLLRNQSLIKPPSMAQLAPYVDKNDVVRVGGRLRFSCISHDAQHPILLPQSSRLTELLIRHYHLSFLHGGPKLILSMLNRRFWVLSGRATVRRVIFSCVPCTRHKAIRPQPTMADLPPFRVQAHRPFSHVGTDFGGPFLVKEHRRRNAQAIKVYLALFVCMSVKAVHLEIVTDLSTDAFLAALDRFVARRGIPSDIYSDCGTNYVGAARQLRAVVLDLFRFTSPSSTRIQR